MLFKWKQGVSDAIKEEISKAIVGLRDRVEVIVDLSWGKTFTTVRSNGFEHGLVVRLKNKQDLDAYRLHEAHVELVDKYIKPHLADVLAMDFYSPRFVGKSVLDQEEEDEEDDLLDEEEDDASAALRRQGSVSIPSDLQPELMQRLHHLQDENDRLEARAEQFRNIAIASTCLATLITGLTCLGVASTRK